MTLTKEQQRALARLATRWEETYRAVRRRAQPTTGLDGAVVVPMFYPKGGTLWHVIEHDGYTHT